MNQDLEHLRLLSIFHYVVAGLTAFFGCFPIIHLSFGIAIVAGKFPENGEAPPAFAGWLFIALAGTFIILGWGMAFASYLAGRSLARHRHYTFCLVVAATECLFMPIGTVLGVFTIIVLNRESVTELFAKSTLESQEQVFSPE